MQVIKGCLKVTRQQLNLDAVLPSGQSFRWKHINPVDDQGDVKDEKASVTNAKEDAYPKKWLGIIDDYVWILQQSSDGTVQYEVLNPAYKRRSHGVSEDDGIRKPAKKKMKPDLDIDKNGTSSSAVLTQDQAGMILGRYFQLNIDLLSLYEEWSKVDPVFKAAGIKLPGIRMLQQDPVENIFSFICSSNNNIIRITQMIGKLCKFYGPLIFDGDAAKRPDIGSVYGFPDIETLAQDGVEKKLRELGFGYRAKFIQQAASHMLEKSHPSNPRVWVESLRDLPYEEVREKLIEIPGVGPKVADCVALMSMGKTEAVPVDTHVRQIVVKKYLPHLAKLKSMTDKSYREMGDFFRDKFGPYAGWAQTTLFCSDLRQFKQESTDSK